MKYFVLLCLIYAGSFSILAGEKEPSVVLDSLLMEGKQNIYDLRFEPAEANFRKIQEMFPEYPHGYVYQAYITVLIFTLDMSNTALEDTLDKQIEKALKISDKFKKANKDDPDSHFMVAMANGVKAVYHVVNRNFIRAYWSGRKTKGNLEKAIKLDSTYYDAYFILGMFHYYADLLPGVLRFFAGILGFDGDRVKGKQEVLSSAENGHFFRVEGKFIYHCIEYFLEGEKQKSIRALEKMYESYPENQALGLIIAYHYRRFGYVQKCIDYCKGFTDEHSDLLPQLTNLKYYNMAICYYELNDFTKTDSMLTVLENLPTRKSKYYEAAIDFYRGHLADIEGDRGAALAAYAKIEDNKQTKYWYGLSRIHVNYPLDSLVLKWIKAQNYMGSRQFDKSMTVAKELKTALAAGEKSVNPQLVFLAHDMLGRNYLRKRRFQESKAAYEAVMPRIKQFKDGFYRTWFYIHYQRTLRQLNEFRLAKKMLDKADDFDDDFTKIIVQREKFVLEKRKKQYEARQAKK